MNFELVRATNESCYLYGSIHLATDYICDTLEFGSSIIIHDGVYYLALGKDESKNETVVLIYDFMQNRVSKLVRNNTYMYKEIKMRRETNDICIGTKIIQPLLTNDEYAAKMIIQYIHGAQNIGKIVTLTIKTPHKLLKTFVRVQ